MEECEGGGKNAPADSIEGVRGETGTDGDGPAEQELGEEVVLEVSGEEHGLERVVGPKVQSTVDDDADARDHEAAVETGDTVRGHGLLVHVKETVELALPAALLGGLGVIG